MLEGEVTSAVEPVKLRTGLPDKSPKDPKREFQMSTRTRSADKALPVKSHESKASQCDLRPNAEEIISGGNGPSPNIRGIKRRICCTCSCDETARPDSRYCSDECGSVTTLTRIFAVMPRLLPTWGLNCDEAKADDLMVGPLILFFSLCIYFISNFTNKQQVPTKRQPQLVLETESEKGSVSEKSSKPAALEKKIGNGPAIKDAGNVSETPSKKPKNPSPVKRAKVLETPTKCNQDIKAPNFMKVSSQIKTQIKEKYLKTPCSSPKNLKAVYTPRCESKDHKNHTPKEDLKKCSDPPNKMNDTRNHAVAKKLDTTDTKALSESVLNQTHIKYQFGSRNKRNYIGRSNVCFDKGLINEPILCGPNESSCDKLKALSQIVSKLLPEQKDYLARRRKVMEGQRRVTSKMPTSKESPKQAC